MLFFSTLAANAGGKSLATHHFTKGWATFGQVVPRGQAWNALRVGDLDTQTDIKNRWDDESIQFAIVSAYIPEDGEYDVIDSGYYYYETPFSPDHDVVEVKVWPLDGSDQTLVATFYPWETPDYWLDGDLLKEHVDFSGLYDADNYEYWHPFLWVGFDCKTYADGQEKMFVWVENTNADDANSRKVPYHVMIKYGGEIVFYKENVDHYYLSRWRIEIPGDDFEESEVTNDLEPIYAAGFLPRHMDSVVRPWNLFDHRPDGAQIMSNWWLEAYMPRSGGREEIALVPDPVGRYLTFRDQTRKKMMLRLADCAGAAFPVHARVGVPVESVIPEGQEYEGCLVNAIARFECWYDDRGHEPWYRYPHRIKGRYFPYPQNGLLVPDNAHVGSYNFVPYLVTGDWFFAEGGAFWANYGVLATMPAAREGRGLIHFNQNRGIGWLLRNLRDAYLMMPEGSPDKEYFKYIIEQNLHKLDDIAASYQSLVFPNFGIWRNEIYEGRLTVGPAEVQRIAYAIHLCHMSGFAGGEYAKHRIIEATLSLFNSPDVYPRQWAAPYFLQVGYVDNQYRHIFFDNLEQARLATFGTGWPGEHEENFRGYYGADALPVLGMAVAEGYLDAEEAYNYLYPIICEWPHIDGVPDLARRAGWAFDMRGSGITSP